MKWDAKLLAERKNEEQAIKERLAKLKEKLNDKQATDRSKWTAGQTNEYLLEQADHGQLTRDLQTKRSEIASLELLEPRTARRASESPLARYLRSGVEGLEADERKEYIDNRQHSVLPSGGGNVFLQRLRPQAVTTATRSDNASGQELVQEEVRPSVVQRLLYYGGVANMAWGFVTADGSPMPFPSHDDSTQEGEILASQDTTVTQRGLDNFGSVTFNAMTCSSKRIRLTREMVQDGIINLPAFVDNIVVRRIGRRWDKAFTNGSGTNEPQGIVPTSKAGITAASASAITFQELQNLIYKVDRSYREGSEMGEGGLMDVEGRMGRIGFMISDDAERLLRNLTDSDGRPLWIPSIREGEPNMILGFPYTVSGQMDAVATGKKPVMFGAFGNYAIRTVGEVEIFRFMDSRTMENNAVECLAFSRRDGRPVGRLTAGKCDAYTVLTMA